MASQTHAKSRCAFLQLNDDDFTLIETTVYSMSITQLEKLHPVIRVTERLTTEYQIMKPGYFLAIHLA